MHDKNVTKSENVKLGIYFCNKYEKKLISLTYKYLWIISNKKTSKNRTAKVIQQAFTKEEMKVFSHFMQICFSSRQKLW